MIKKKDIKWLILLAIIFFVFWRTVVHIKSERYCAIIVIPFIVLSAYQLHSSIITKTPVRKKIIYSILLFVLLFFNLLVFLSSYSKRALLDIKDDFAAIESKDRNSLFYIYHKEFFRIKPKENPNFINLFEVSDEDQARLGELVSPYASTWNSRVYLLLYFKDSSFRNKIKGLDDRFTLVRKLNSNKKNSRFLCLYAKKERENAFYQYHEISPKSLFTNGDMEIVITQPQIGTIFKNLIQDDTSFYSAKNLKIPKHDILVPTWGDTEHYTKLYADSQNPIQGQYSLHVSFPEEIDCRLYFFKQVDSKPGSLYFTIRSCKMTSPLMLSKIDYNITEKQNKNPRYYLYPSPKNTEYYSIHFDKDNFSGTKSLFFIQGMDADFLIDDIAYIPDCPY